MCEIFGARAGLPPGVCGAIGLRPQGIDGFVKVSGDDWNAGYNVGLLLTPSDRTRIGLAYRSWIHHDLGGQATFLIPPKAKILKSTGALRNTGAHAAVDLPERVALSAFHRLTARWTVLSDITWTHWTSFEQIVFRFDNPSQPTIVQPENWSDSFRYSLGVVYQATRALSFRLGSADDENPIPDPAHRTPRIPDADRIWLAAGAGLRATDRIRLDLGYAHLFSPRVSTENADPVTGHVIRGHYTLEANIVGVQVSYQLGWPPWSLGR